MKYILILQFVLFAFSARLVNAQKAELSNPEAFVQDLQKLFAQSNNQRAIISANEFIQLWNEQGLTGDQKSKVILISQKMLKKNFKTTPHIENFIIALNHSVRLESLSKEKMDQLLFVTEAVIDKYENNDAYNYLQTVSDFLKLKTLYNSSFNKLYAHGGSYSFDFIETKEPEIEEVVQSEPKAEDNDGWFSDWDNNNESDWGSSWDKETTSKNETNNILAQLPKVEQPVISGAVIIFNDVDLIFKTNFDSTGIRNTQGSFMFRSNIFVGKGGKFDWIIAGLSPDSVFCELEEYNFNVNKVYLLAENSKLTYFGKLDKPIEGIFEFQSQKHNGPNDAKFPRFKSYQNDINVKNLGKENLKYNGGFSLSGKEIYSSSVMDGIATIEVHEKGKKKFQAKSDRFNLKDSLITAQRSTIVIYQNNDSIYHPTVNFKYNADSEFLTLTKDIGGFKNTPFYASYYKMDIFSDMIRWDLTSDSLDISILNAKNQLPAVFESQEYFNELRFNNLTGLYSFHPLQMVVGYSRKIKSEEFYSQDMAREMKQNPATVKGAMVFLMQNGFIDYEPKIDLVKIKRKGIHYVLSRAERKDFDNLAIPSISASKPNATLNFKDQKLVVRGINKFYISELLEVFIQPENEEITLLKDRDFVFDGRINAGNYEYIGKNFQFNYDSFLVQLNQIDSIKFNITTDKKDRDNKKIKKRLDNQIVQTSGTLYINKPDNKSSKRIFAQYPIFSADKGALVYFNGKEVLGGGYDKDVYFSIPPFEIDSVSSSDPKSISFNGTFNSGGIFPEIEASIKLMPDQSLGFEYKTPPSGIPLYGGAGSLFSDISLDNKGLRSSGKIEYLNATLHSDDFIFYQDSTITVGKEMEFKEGKVANALFPQATLNGYKMRWLPKQDSMMVTNLKEPFNFYNNTATLSGTTTITPRGVFAEGKVLTRGSEMFSRDLKFQQVEFSARHANFRITTSNPKKPALSGMDIRINFDLKNNTASISPEKEGVAALDFPYAQVRTSINTAIWNLEDKTVHMSKPKDVDISQSYFYTTRKDLDSLVFNATAAVYDINQLKLNVSGIPYIKVADAKITPENNEVLILENAELQQLQNAVVVIDTLNEYHRLINGKIKIHSRKKFEGNATYQYVNAQEDTFAIKFASFQLYEDPSRKKGNKPFTISSGEVSDKENLIISPGILYKGKLTMFAIKDALELDGFVKLDLKKNSSSTWIKYKSEAENQEVAFDFENSLTENNEPLHAGLHFDGNNSSLYGTFLAEPHNIGDEEFFKPSGTISFDNESKEFKIQNLNKVNGQSYAGKIFTYNEETSDIKAEGSFNFIKNLPKFNIVSAGKLKGNLDNKEYHTNTFMSFNFDIPTQALDIMGLDIKEVTERVGSPAAHSDRSTLLYKAAEVIGDRAAKEYEKRSLEDYTPLVSVSGELIRPLVISDVDMKWSDKHRAWYSTSKISVSNIMKHDINAKLDGFMEIKKVDGGGEIVNVFIQASSATWYYLSFENNRLLLFSSNDEFNSVIKSKSTLGKAKLGEVAFTASDIAETMTFLNNFRKIYFDIDVPYQLDLPTENKDMFEEDPFNTFQDDSDTPGEKDQPDDSDGF
jgi:hypothetical protein